MGHRHNGLPFLRLVPEQFVINNNLKRIHHRTLMPYNESEGLRLPKNRWHIHDPKEVFVTALDQCMTLAYTGTLSSPISTKKSQEDIVCDDETQDGASPDQDHGGETPLSQPTQDVAQSNKIPIATPRFGNPRVGMQLVTTANVTLREYHSPINQSADPLRSRLSQMKHHLHLVVLSNPVSR